MPLTAAERQRQYRQRLKDKDEEGEKEKERKRWAARKLAGKVKNIADLTPKQQLLKRQKWKNDNERRRQEKRQKKAWETPATQRKRKANKNTPQTSKKHCNQIGAPNKVLNTEAAVVKDEDTCDVKPMLIVKLPKESRNTGDVFDSESDHFDSELPSVLKIKCENEETPAQNTQTPEGSQDKGSTSKKLRGKSNTGKESEANTSSANIPLESPSARSQTLLADDQENSVLQLNNLRRNIAKLLRVILPEMGVFANIALENVDNAVIEVLQGNAVTIDDQSLSSEQKTARKNSATSKED